MGIVGGIARGIMGIIVGVIIGGIKGNSKGNCRGNLSGYSYLMNFHILINMRTVKMIERNMSKSQRERVCECSPATNFCGV